MKKKDILHYSGAAGIFLLVIFILLYFANNSIPKENKDIIISIVGIIIGSLSVVMYSLIGKNPDEVKDLTAKVESQQKHIEQLVEQKDAYEALMINLQKDIINKLSMAGEVIFKSVLEKK